MPSVVRECRWCHRRQLVSLDTDGRGGVVEEALPCGCDDLRERRRCIDCREPHGGAKQRLRCEACRVVAARAYSFRWRANHPDRARASEKRSAKKRRAQKRAYCRRYWREKSTDPQWRARRNARRRELGAKNPGRKAAAGRRYKERHPDRVKAQQGAANRRRAGAKREYMHLYATKYVGEGKSPMCRKCGGEVPWAGCGRPRLDCYDCRPLDARERRAAGDEPQEKAA